MNPFRCEHYNDSDKKFADYIKGDYGKVSYELQIEFNKFTSNLMDDVKINRNELLKAIDAFELENTHKLLFVPTDWYKFSDKVYKYNPYCSIL